MVHLLWCHAIWRDNKGSVRETEEEKCGRVELRKSFELWVQSNSTRFATAALVLWAGKGICDHSHAKNCKTCLSELWQLQLSSVKWTTPSPRAEDILPYSRGFLQSLRWCFFFFLSLSVCDFWLFSLIAKHLFLVVSVTLKIILMGCYRLQRSLL